MKQHHPGLGIALIVLMSLCFASMDSAVKYLGGFLPVLLILWARYSFQAMVMLIWLTCSQSASFRVTHPKFQIMRGVLLLISSAMAFLAVQYLPIAEYTAIGMLTPVIVTLFAAWFLHESVSRLRWTLVLGALAGALLIIRPGSGLFGWAILFPLAGALSFASFQVLTSKLAALEDPYTTHFYSGLTGMVFLTPLLFLTHSHAYTVLSTTQAFHLGLLLCIGLLGTAGHLLLIFALGVTPAAVLMPFAYAQIGFATVLGWIVFYAVPDAWAWLGMGIIVVSGAASAWLNVREAAPQRPLSALAADTMVE